MSPEEENAQSVAQSNTGGSGRWWRFGGSNTVSDIKKDDKPEEKKPEEPKKTPLEKIVEEIPG